MAPPTSALVVDSNSAPAADTVTDSLVSPICNVTPSCTLCVICATRSFTSTSARLMRHHDAVSAGHNRRNALEFVSFVVAVGSSLVGVFRITTVALGIAAPLTSITSPRMLVDILTCAKQASVSSKLSTNVWTTYAELPSRKVHKQSNEMQACGQSTKVRGGPSKIDMGRPIPRCVTPRESCSVILSFSCSLSLISMPTLA